MHRKVPFILLVCLSALKLSAQISPGGLSAAHSAYEGISNCTKCHVLGNKVSSDKCLACHSEISSRISKGIGYHNSPEVKGKLCFSCHSEHNGKEFNLIRLDASSFDHTITGYKLSKPHAAQECRKCHTAENISDPVLKARKNTWLGVNSSCLTCHEDYHQQTLSSQCLKCHSDETFRPASGFDHSSARFKLNGKHRTVDCIKCHRVENINGKKFQEFRGLKFSNCTNCHNDPHQNKFGQNCRQCHTEESFSVRKNTMGFDHAKTGFPLEGKHMTVDCNSCHKGKLSDPLRHGRCSDCHPDYHKGQLIKNGISPDCSECHSVNGFTSFSFTIERHNSGPFKLNDSHQAVPCMDCHRKNEKWSFRNIGTVCRDCHPDIHERIIEPRFYPGGDCRVCHSEKRWAEVTFDHSLTRFELTGAHVQQKCRACHFRPDDKGIIHQKFYELSAVCASCHTDNHFRQFEKNGITNCSDCHGTENWNASKFNHSETAFQLDGKHRDVPCAKCHKPKTEGSVTFIEYKIKDFRCESCHY
jgi:hypothetical protein